MNYFNKKHVVAIGTLLILFSLILGSCVKDILDLTNIKNVHIEDDYNPDFAVPLLHANLSALDFADKYDVSELIRIEDDYLITILYKSRDWYGYAKDYIVIPDQHFSLGPLVYNTGGDDSVRVTTNILFDENQEHSVLFNDGEEIVFLEVKSGFLILNVHSTFPRSGQLELSIPYAKQNGLPYSKTIPLNWNWPSITLTDSIDLSKVEFDLSKGGTLFNTVPVEYIITLNPNSRFVHASDEINITADFKDVKFAYIEGYLGAEIVPYSADTMSLTLFDGTEADRVSFVDPKIKVNVYNSTGLPIRVDPPYFSSFSKKHGELELSGSLVNSPIDIIYPLPSEVGVTKYTLVEANKSNSNLPQVVNNMPKYINYDLTVRTNPDGKSYSNFALDTSYVKVNVDMELPAYGRSEEWAFDFPTKVDPIDFDLKIIEEAEFSIVIANDFPVEIAVQLYIIDSSETIIDSLMDKSDYFIAAAHIGVDHRTITPAKSVTKIVFNEDRMENIAKMRKVRAVVCLSTKNKGQEDIKIFADSRIDLKFGLRTKLKVNLNDL